MIHLMAKRHPLNEFWNLERKFLRAAASRDKYQADKLKLITSLRDTSRSRDAWKEKCFTLQQELAALKAAAPPSGLKQSSPNISKLT
jgi:hypothetical protein